MVSLTDPVKLGGFEAKNRVFMAPLTRTRSTREHVPTALMVDYYTQRASAGLIISEATGISQEGLGTPYAPGIWSAVQVDAWKPVVESVHARGGKIVCQLWHMGRAVHSNITGLQPVSASATTFPTDLHTYDGKKKPEQARALTKEDLRRIVQDYRTAASNAIVAGFDGVQIHAANGYLIDQFLRDSGNFRTDEYGGSIENRVRFLDEVVAAVVDTIGADRTGVRLSPNGECQGVVDSNPGPLFKAATEVLNKHGVPWLELREPNKESTFGGRTDQPQEHETIRSAFKGVLVLNQEYNRAKLDEALSSGIADAVSFGRLYISHPDLFEKLSNNVPLADPGNSTIRWWYSQSPDGYTDLRCFGAHL